MKARASRGILFCGVLSIVSFAVSADAAAPPSKESVKVEFRCKIVKPPKENYQALERWVVQIKRAAGQSMGVEAVLDGQTVRFRDLDPGIYSVCVFGTLNRQRCESIDMYPPPGRSSYSMSRRLEAPASLLGRSDLNKVSLGDLSVPQAARDELLKAEVARSRDQIEEAIEHLQEAIRIFPDYADALNNLGTCYFQNHQYVKSEECFAKVTQLNPEFYGGWVNLSSSLLSLSRFAEAFDASKHAYEMLPQEPIVIGYYAKSLYYLRKFDAAKTEFEKLKLMDPANQTYPQLFLAQIALVQGKPATAEQYLKEFLQLHPNSPEARHYRDFLKNVESLSASALKSSQSRTGS
jgi:tetratricopeptide (TPR) repeat protein